MSIVLSENFRALFYAPFYATQATGAFRARASRSMIALAQSRRRRRRAARRRGRRDVGRAAARHDAARQEPAADLVCFCDVVARDPFFVIGARPRPDFRFADLKGLRFATVSEVPTPWICLANDLRQAGVDPTASTAFGPARWPRTTRRSRAGTLDAIQVFQPYAEGLIASGAGHLWYAAATRGLTAYTTLVTRRDARPGAPTSSSHDPRHPSHPALVRGDAGARDRAAC